METKLTILGTGNAMAVDCYNTCFALETGEGILLVDAGGGNGIFRQLRAAGIPIERIRAMYLTHGHTDHILGAIWMVRKVAQMMENGKYAGTFRIYGHEKVISMLETFCTMTVPGRLMKRWGKELEISVVENGERFRACGMELTAFDIHSTKEKQFGFRAVLPNGKTLCCLGDEPFNEACRDYGAGADYLLSEAFCLHGMADRFRPYEKHHSTALDAGRVARDLGARTLILYHTEDETLSTRKETYTAESREAFPGTVLVPEDLEQFILS